MTYVSLSRICNLATHRGHKLLTRIDGIEIWYCEKVQGLRLHGHSDSIESIKLVVEAAKNVVPKVENEKEGQEKHAFENKIYEEADRISRIKRGTGMHWYTVHKWFEWIVKVTEILSAFGHPLAVDGVLKKIKEELRPYKAYVRLRDVAGDPPIIEALFTCPVCNTSWDLSGLTSGTDFACTGCGNWFSYTLDGDVEKAYPPSNTATICGVVVDAAGKGLAGTTLYFNKKRVVTDENGYFVYPHVPQGKYRVTVSNPAYEVANLLVEVNETREYNLGSIRLVSRVPRYVAITAPAALAGGIVGGVATHDPLGAVAGLVGGALAGLLLNIVIDLASGAPPL